MNSKTNLLEQISEKIGIPLTQRLENGKIPIEYFNRYLIFTFQNMYYRIVRKRNRVDIELLF